MPEKRCGAESRSRCQPLQHMVLALPPSPPGVGPAPIESATNHSGKNFLDRMQGQPLVARALVFQAATLVRPTSGHMPKAILLGVDVGEIQRGAPTGRESVGQRDIDQAEPVDHLLVIFFAIGVFHIAIKPDPGPSSSAEVAR